MQHPLIVLTLEGLSPAALSCFGSSWNRTPTIDSLASEGFVWDRCIANSDVPDTVFWQMAERMLTEIEPGNGSVELLTDVQSIADDIRYTSFDRIDLVSTDQATAEDVPETDPLDTQLGRLFASAIERDAEKLPWSLLWLHSGFLTNRWDGPQEDCSIESVIPPTVELNRDDHPDLVTSWMETYASQIRLLDELLDDLLDALAGREPRIMIAGTSGFRLGQGGWIGHHVGPLRSRDVHVPMIFRGSGPLRFPNLCSTDSTASEIGRLASGSEADQHGLSHDDGNSIEIESSRAKQNLTTLDWFFVRDSDDSEHLFLKPDDIDDFNDVARLRPDVVAEFGPRMKNPAGR